ncbi:MAG: hypothetical protein ACPGUD_13635 [Parashewanella sp.]
MASTDFSPTSICLMSSDPLVKEQLEPKNKLLFSSQDRVGYSVQKKKDDFDDSLVPFHEETALARLKVLKQSFGSINPFTEHDCERFIANMKNRRVKIDDDELNRFALYFGCNNPLPRTSETITFLICKRSVSLSDTLYLLQKLHVVRRLEEKKQENDVATDKLSRVQNVQCQQIVEWLPKRYSVTPLMLCALLGTKDGLLQMISDGARLDDKDFKHATALHYAVLGGNVLNAQTLLINGALHAERNNRGETPFKVAGAQEQKLQFPRLTPEQCETIMFGEAIAKKAWCVAIEMCREKIAKIIPQFAAIWRNYDAELLEKAFALVLAVQGIRECSSTPNGLNPKPLLFYVLMDKDILAAKMLINRDPRVMADLFLNAELIKKLDAQSNDALQQIRQLQVEVADYSTTTV